MGEPPPDPTSSLLHCLSESLLQVWPLRSLRMLCKMTQGSESLHLREAVLADFSCHLGSSYPLPDRVPWGLRIRAHGADFSNCWCVVLHESIAGIAGDLIPWLGSRRSQEPWLLLLPCHAIPFTHHHWQRCLFTTAEGHKGSLMLGHVTRSLETAASMDSTLLQAFALLSCSLLFLSEFPHLSLIRRKINKPKNQKSKNSKKQPPPNFLPNIFCGTIDLKLKNHFYVVMHAYSPSCSRN